MAAERDWDQRYRDNQMPWDTGRPCECLVRWFESEEPAVQSALEIGCGRGHSAIWLAQRGLAVTAVDISAVAIDQARHHADESAVELELAVHDIRCGLPVAERSVDFIFDRGVYHILEPDERERVAGLLARALRPGGHWLSLAGNADETSPDGKGPPRLTAEALTAGAERHFSLRSLTPVRLETSFGQLLFWQAHWRRR